MPHKLDTAAVLSRGYLISSCVTTQLTHNHDQAKAMLQQLSDEVLKVRCLFRHLPFKHPEEHKHVPSQEPLLHLFLSPSTQRACSAGVCACSLCT